MVERDEITLDSSYLDVESMTLQGENTVADIISKAIMWNYGFSAPDMVLRTHALRNDSPESSPTRSGMSDAAKTLDSNFSWDKIGSASYIKHGNIVALYHTSSQRFVSLTRDWRVNGKKEQRAAHTLPREWASERFLVIQKGDKVAFYSLTHNRYIRASDGYLDGQGGCVHLDAPRFCELFQVQSLSSSIDGGFVLETSSGEMVFQDGLSLTLTHKSQGSSRNPGGSPFQAVLISDYISDDV